MGNALPRYVRFRTHHGVCTAPSHLRFPRAYDGRGVQAHRGARIASRVEKARCEAMWLARSWACCVCHPPAKLARLGPLTKINAQRGARGGLASKHRRLRRGQPWARLPGQLYWNPAKASTECSPGRRSAAVASSRCNRPAAGQPQPLAPETAQTRPKAEARAVAEWHSPLRRTNNLEDPWTICRAGRACFGPRGLPRELSGPGARLNNQTHHGDCQTPAVLKSNDDLTCGARIRCTNGE